MAPMQRDTSVCNRIPCESLGKEMPRRQGKEVEVEEGEMGQ